MPPKPIGLDQHESSRPWPGVTDVNENQQVRPQSDRDFQDRIICFLADANLRSTAEDIEFLDEGEVKRAKRFSKFLARRYYRDRLQRAFRYANNLIALSSRAETIVDSAQFEAVLDGCVLGSIATARDVGGLAVALLSPQNRQPWWNELLEYEFAFFVQLATSETVPLSSFVRRNSSTVMRRFRIRIPELISYLKAGKTDCADLAGEATLLFSRTRHGKIYVVELDQNTAAVFTAIDGRRSVPEIASSVGIPVEEIHRIFAPLYDIGAVVPPVPATLEPSV